MPYECEECGKLGARLNSLFDIRLCVDCVSSSKYKLICKSKALSKYLLTKADLENFEELLEEYLVKNPHYKSGPPMTLYLESEIQKIFLSKYYEVIKKIFNKFILDNVNDCDYIQNEIIDKIKNSDLDELNLDHIIKVLNNKMDLIINNVSNYLKEQKNMSKEDKFYKILDKYNIVNIVDLPKWVQIELNESKSIAEYERILSSYFRFVKLHKLLKKEKLVEYLDHKICHDYIYQKDKRIILEQIPYIIKFMLEKKKLFKEEIKKNKINISKYSYIISKFINSYESEIELISNAHNKNKTIENDLDTLIEYINKNENEIKQKKIRKKELETKLELRNLVLRSDSVLCSNYIEGSNEYTSDEIVDIMEQMNWFFNNTKYSQYSKQYDDEQYEKKKFNWYDHNDIYYHKSRKYYDSYSDSDFDSDYYESEKMSRQNYNKIKSEYVKKKCLKEWILNGKKGIFPQSLIPLIEQIENEINDEKIKQKIKPQPNMIKKNLQKKNPCSNPKCCNIYSSSCKNKMCKICCNGIECEMHKYKLVQNA